MAMYVLTAAADPVRIVGAAQRAGSAQDTCQSHVCQGYAQQGTGKLSEAACMHAECGMCA